MAWRVWSGRIVVGLISLFLFMDAVVHILKIQPVLEAFEKLSLPIALSLPLGILVLLCLLILAIPRTRLLGAVLLTGYLGGAIAIHLRAGSTAFEVIFPVIIGSLLWIGLYLLDSRVAGALVCKK
jgi:hypothetical protein